MGRVIKSGNKGNIGSAVCYCNINKLGIAVGIVRCIRGMIKFLRIIGSLRLYSLDRIQMRSLILRI